MSFVTLSKARCVSSSSGIPQPSFLLLSCHLIYQISRETVRTQEVFRYGVFSLVVGFPRPSFSPLFCHPLHQVTRTAM